MKLLVFGSPTIKEFDFSPYVTPEIDTVICDGERGIAALAEQYADSHRLSKYVVRPRRDARGRALLISRSGVEHISPTAINFRAFYRTPPRKVRT